MSVAIGLAVYLGTAALGTSAQLGWVNTRPFRWLHHVLFAAVWISLILAIGLSWPHGWSGALIGVGVCMAILPRFRAGTRAHCLSALIGLGCYVTAIGWLILAG